MENTRLYLVVENTELHLTVKNTKSHFVVENTKSYLTAENTELCFMAENTKSYCTAENTKYSTAETPEFCYPCRYDGVQPLRSILCKSLIHSFPAHPGLSPSSKRKHTVQPRWDSGIVLESFFGIFRPEQTSVGFSQTRNMSCAPAGWSWEPSTHSQGTTTGKAPR